MRSLSLSGRAMQTLHLKASGHQLARPTHNFSLVQPHQASILCLFNMKPYRISSLQTKTKQLQATLAHSVPVDLGNGTRRSSDYHPTIWDSQFIESIHSPWEGGDFNARIEELKQEVKQLLKETDTPLGRLELIDLIQRLGVAYHFGKEIGDVLQQFYVDGLKSLHGLKEIALCFRLLREHGHNVSCDVFQKFKEEKEFMNCLSQDVKGLLNLYEATHLALPGEQILEEAKEFSVKNLQCLGEDIDLNLAEQVRHSLNSPAYWLMPRVEARHFIDVNDKEEGKYKSLLELAKLEFNVVQAMHQKEIKELSRWWEQLGLMHKVDFSRDRIVECYLWANGMAFEPQFSKVREVAAKVVSLLNVIDDFYDIYSTLEEAELFTSAIRRWDLEAMKDLPDYLQLCYFALYNFVNDTTYDILKDYGWDVRCFLAREVTHLCEAYLKEAEWFHKGITPSLEEYLRNGWTSVGNRILVFFALYYVGHDLTKESLDHLEQAHQLIYKVSRLVRLLDDLAPSKAEGEASLSIHCRMKDSGESYETSKEFIEDLICSLWKEINEETLNRNLPRNFIYVAINTARTCYDFFQQGDGLGDSFGITTDRINSLFIEPIPLECS